jgi:hypothetical protein
LDVAVNPGPQGGALEIELPRSIIDSKTAANTDKPYVVLMAYVLVLETNRVLIFKTLSKKLKIQIQTEY